MGSFLGCSFVELCQYFLCNPADKSIYQRRKNKQTDKWTQVKALTALMKRECKNLQTNCVSFYVQRSVPAFLNRPSGITSIYFGIYNEGQGKIMVNKTRL